MRTIYRVALVLALMPVLALAECTDVRSYVGGEPAPANINWERPANWLPTGVPTPFSHAIIEYGSPYVAVTSTIGAALDLTINEGGKLALRVADSLKVLAIVTDVTVNTGGSFVGVGASGQGGPNVFIGGNIVNHGTWNLSGIATGHPSVRLLSLTRQRISGSHMLVFQNLWANNKFYVDGVDVYVTGTYTGPWPEEINNGHFIVGESPLPITLAYFRAGISSDGQGVHLTWRTVTEVNNYGFYVERRRQGEETYQSVAFVPTQGNGIVAHEYAVSDPAVTAGAWNYRLRQVDLDGTETSTEDVIVDLSTLTAVNDATAPASFGLAQNYPNPFNPTTVVSCQLPVAGMVRLVVYDMLGREVAVLMNGELSAGEHQFTFNATGLASGTYLCRLESGSTVEMKKMVLMK
jgi:hypothetical protein